MKFSLLTYNIHKGFSQRKKFILHDMKDALLAIEPDIICLQELQGEHRKLQQTIEKWPEQEQLDFLAGNNWPHYVYGKNVKRKHSDHGNGILSKLPISHHDNIDISSSIFSSRGLLHTIIALEHTPLHVMCTHLGLLKSERRSQFTILEQHIKEHVPDNEPLIIAGDFNDWLAEAGQNFCDNVQLKEVFIEMQGKPAKSFPTIKPVLAVDKIYYRHLQAVSCKVLTAEPWNKLSDHVPLWVEFELP